MELINKGYFIGAQKELKNNKNNAVAYVYENSLKQGSGVLSDAVFTIKDVFATKDAKTTASSKILETLNPVTMQHVCKNYLTQVLYLLQKYITMS